MRKARCSVLLFICAAALAACGASEWQSLEVSEGAFAVLMRGQPHYVKQDIDTPAGKMTAHLYSSDRPDAYYAVGYVDYPLALVTGVPPEKLFANVRDTWVRRIQGKLTASDDTLKLEGKYPALEFWAEGTNARGSKLAAKADADAPGNAPAKPNAPAKADPPANADAPAKPVATFVQARLYLVDQRLYQVIAMGRKGEVPQGDVNRYLKSFRLIPQSEVGSIKIEPKGK
jgi:hypothetical protein